MIPARLRNILGACTLMAVAVIAYIEVGKIRGLAFDPLGETAFPRFIAVVIAILALIWLVQSVMAPPEKDDGLRGGAPVRVMQALGAMATFALFALTIRYGWLPFPLSGVLFCILTGLIYTDALRARPVITVLVVAAVFAPAVDLLFRYYFYVEMP